MDNDIFIPYKFRASQIVGIAKVAVKFIEANGIRFQELDPSKEAPPYEKLNKMSWFNSEQAKVREFIQALTLKAFKQHYLEFTVQGDWGNVLMSLMSTDNEPTAANPAGIDIGVVDRITKAINFRTLFDSEKRSGFLAFCFNRFPAGAPYEIDIGVNSVNYFEGSQISTNTVVEHKLGRVPQVIFGCCLGAPSPAFVGASNAFSPTTTSFAMNFMRPGVAGTSAVAFYWIAIG